MAIGGVMRGPGGVWGFALCLSLISSPLPAHTRTRTPGTEDLAAEPRARTRPAGTRSATDTSTGVTGPDDVTIRSEEPVTVPRSAEADSSSASSSTVTGISRSAVVKPAGLPTRTETFGSTGTETFGSTGTETFGSTGTETFGSSRTVTLPHRRDVSLGSYEARQDKSEALPVTESSDWSDRHTDAPTPLSDAAHQGWNAPLPPPTDPITHILTHQTHNDLGAVETASSIGQAQWTASLTDLRTAGGAALQTVSLIAEHQEGIQEETTPQAATTATHTGSIPTDDRHDEDLSESSSPSATSSPPTSIHPSLGFPDNDLPPSLESMTPPLLVHLGVDWNAAMATWGLGWELHVLGLGGVFGMVGVLAGMGGVCVALLRRPRGGAHGPLFLLQVLACSSRAVWLLYDPYGQRERLPVAWGWLLQEAPYPCMTASLLLLLLLPLSSRLLLSQRALQHCVRIMTGLLLLLLMLQVAMATVSAALIRLLPVVPPVVLLLSPASFILLASLLFLSFLLFFCYGACADAPRIQRLAEGGGSPDRQLVPAHRLPLGITEAGSESGAWRRAGSAALFLLACAGLRLYALLHAVEVARGNRRAVGLGPWAWWGLQLACRVCEVGVCVSVLLVLTHSLRCEERWRCAPPKPTGWRSLLQAPPATEAASPGKPHILPVGRGWTLRPGEKLSLCEGLSRRQSESVPLYSLLDPPLSETSGLDLQYPGGPLGRSATLLKAKRPQPLSIRSSFASLTGGSTADLRPPSPIDLRRSIDEALHGDFLFPRSLFCSSRLSLSTRGPPDGQPCRRGDAETHLYRTASCGDADPLPGNLSAPPQRTPQAWRSRGSTGSLAHCRGRQDGLPHTRLTTLGSGSSGGGPEGGGEQRYSPAEELAVQAEFISVCRQIDALSVCSDTIDL